MYSIHEVGADVEVFLKDAQGNPVPVCGLLGGTKENPRLLWPKVDGFSAVQEDNVMAEFNICPAKTPEKFRIGVEKVLGALTKELKKKDLYVDISASKEFKAEQLLSPQAQHVGCSIDYNAWTMKENPQVKPDKLGNVRTSGGHVHLSVFYGGNFVGETPDANIHNARIVRMLDLYLGVPSVLLDTDTRRKEYYGKAGAYRPKWYGPEYRVLSNFWIGNAELIEWVHGQCRAAINQVNQYMRHGDKNGCLPKDYCSRVIQCINTNNKKEAHNIVKEYGLYVPDPNLVGLAPKVFDWERLQIAVPR